MAKKRQTYQVPAPEDISSDPYEQVLWYDTLPLPSEPTVEQEVLRPMGMQSSFREKKPPANAQKAKAAAQPRAYNWARGIIAMEVLGAPRSQRPWRPR